MAEDEDEGDACDAREAVCIGQAPGQGGQEEKEGEQIGKRGVGAVPCIARLF